MASLHKYLSIFITFFLFCCSCNAYNFNVGGKNGWTIPPSESYNQWAGRLRFNVNDTLHFKYNGGSDSVMVVNNGDYDNCNTNNPITTLTGGDSYYNLNHSGPFYFISGNKSNCDQGQKLIVVVISPKKIATPPAATAPAMSPASSPESGIVMPSSPVGSPGEGVASSPTMNPADANAPAGAVPGGTSPAARLPVSVMLSVTLVMMLFGLGWLN
ncbi:early nodulin-like protein 3 [Artemisia annua]|uniref:Early nodulin-like protein 3 n=1 Tax=Artemisia annua TaxID=35608 RepID=A0A2U1QGV3_ARTAN|nr:early nodulin-like protein 3 [Artemisia annua]